MATLPVLRTLDEVCSLVAERHAAGSDLFVRFSDGVRQDRRMGASTNHQTGRREAGLAVNNLVSKGLVWDAGDRWFTAMNLREYAHFGPVCYLLTGTVVGEGSDGEPLLVDWTPVATVAGSVLDEAKAAYATR